MDHPVPNRLQGQAKPNVVQWHPGQASPSAERAPGAADDQDPVLGPNTDLVLEFLDRLDKMAPAAASALVAAWRVQPQDRLHSAHGHLQAIADDDPDARRQLRLAQDEVFSWTSRRRGVGTSTSGVALKRDEYRIVDAAAPAAVDAVAALVVADLLEPEDAEVLYAPWAGAVGEPELPEYEDDPAEG